MSPLRPFPRASIASAWPRARKILRQNGIDCCVSVAPEHLYCFGGYDSWVSINSPHAMIFMADGGESALIVRDVDLALPRETSWIGDVRSYHLFSDNVPALIASVVREKGLAGGKVVIGSYTLTENGLEMLIGGNVALEIV